MTARTYNVVPEGGQGADLRVSESEVALALSALNGQAHDRVSLVASFSENQRAEVLQSETTRQLNSGGGKPGQGYLAVRQDSDVRRLTPTECERLQAFPDGWTDFGPDTRRYAALGDAVTVTVAEWIGRRLIAADERGE